jgi:hypothetical protein
MITIEEHVQRIVAASRGDEQSLIHMIARELQLLHAALPAPAYLESVAVHLEVSCVQDFDLPDGTTFDGPVFLRHAARLVRLAISEARTGPSGEGDESGRHANRRPGRTTITERA